MANPTTEQSTTEGEDLEHGDDHHNHPGVREYIEVAAILAVLTAMEVAIHFLPIASRVAVPVLIVLTIMKFLLVILWFMHLRFDTPLFRRLFAIGLAFASVLFLVTAIMSL
ncbi:cytochrome C oxidase subunit IV [Egibacter rhizosphaerae]|uniref:Cytochrome C oxidase subunit IV n=1 Tax=Egibacter rhizosphaerae TaxID=1670831 RepID=A0A411YAQ9_9ACTN|nr:cytochrome C oxidase subunit IV family protein [Egibacter rhizosphaerae]QBI18291.1 cytochrome C oxidase subunit IV [Egibacter rhizosphaerae]